MIKRVLVVDPDEKNLAFLREKLDATNLKVWTAPGGEAALERLDRENYDVVVAALEMAPMHGIDLCQSMRLRGRETPVILLSRRPVQDATEAAAAGRWEGVMILPRPLFLNRLYTAIEAALGMRILWAEMRMAPRLPLKLELKIAAPGSTDVIVPVHTKTLDLSIGGLRFERPMCTVCTGYEKGGVHPDCVLRPYALRVVDSRMVRIDLQVSPTETLKLHGRVAYTLIEEGSTREFIGVRFVDMNADDRERLRKLLASAQPDADPA